MNQRSPDRHDIHRSGLDIHRSGRDPLPWFALPWLLCTGLVAFLGGDAEAQSIVESPVRTAAVDFGREIRPILAKHCFTCHGPDEGAREAGLRLDVRDEAVDSVIIPGDAEGSELIFRVSSDDVGLRMPPGESQPALSDREIETLRRWIDGGANYETHWAFLPPQTPEVPAVADERWCRTPIDRFTLGRMEAAGLTPAAEADRATLIRRVTLDLTGVVPTPDEVRRFVADTSPDAYRRLVERLLASPDYAERFARPWLDLARYSDTNGYEKDRPRTIWPYRDWVIDAIATDMPFDQFSIEQLAGDMSPDATAEQRIATGFHRNTMLNEEGGIDPLEYRYYALVDRVATTGTVWLGLTTGCAQCHTHKYDPITHTDYYGLLALFNGADEPELSVPDQRVTEERRRLETRIEQLENRLVTQSLPSWEAFEGTFRPRSDEAGTFFSRRSASDLETQPASASDSIRDAFLSFVTEQYRQARPWQIVAPTEMESTLPKLTLLEDGSVLASGDVTKRDVYRLTIDPPPGAEPLTAMRLEVLPHESLPAGGPGLAYYEGRRGDFFLSELIVRRNGQRVPLENASHSYGKISVGSGSAEADNVIDGEGSTGWSTSGAEGTANQWVVQFAEPLRLAEVPEASDSAKTAGSIEVEMIFERHFAAALGRFRLAVTSGAAPVLASQLPVELSDRMAVLADDGEPPDPVTYAALQRHFIRHAPELAEQRQPIDRLRRSMPEPVRTLVMQERAAEDRRVTHRHHRGEYLQPKERVEPALPSMFRDEQTPPVRDRLQLARWLASPDNPLVARVTVNRAWRQFFGTGLVRTAGDFGTQSEPPSHPQLLDWLATDWMRQGWSMKRLHRQIVLSATYRQSVGPPPEVDPDHRLLSAMPYRRLDAELIRDAMLSASGLLTREVGGASVYPPQPESVTGIAYGSPAWRTSSGGDRFRRSLYTFGKRTAPFAAFTTFDGPSGEVCLARRDESTTPLQALTLMNDAMYLEIARKLAEDVLRQAPAEATADDLVQRMFRRLLTRSPSNKEREAITTFYERVAKRNSTAADHADTAGETDRTLDVWTLVARALMNTDEAITTP